MTARSVLTLAALDAAMEAAQDADPRPYLGISGIGGPCDRALWYGWRGASTGRIGATGLRAIQDGFAGEEVMATRLRMIPGVDLHTVDRDTGKQIAVASSDGHVRGHLDGVILGVLEAPDVWHVWEHKQVNEARFRKLAKLADADESKALAKWDTTYHAQAQCYMGLAMLDWHFLTVGTPGGREYVAVRTAHDPAESDRLLARAERIVASAEPPPRMSDDPEHFECKWCRSFDICHGNAAPRVNCRTCAHATPMRTGGGAWACERGQNGIQEPRRTHDCHRYIPSLLERIGTAVDADDDSVTYQTPAGDTFVNGPAPGFSSYAIHVGQHHALREPVAA